MTAQPLFGHPDTVRPGTGYDGTYPCKGARHLHSTMFGSSASPGSMQSGIRTDDRLHPIQAAWLLANEPLRFTGRAMSDIPHLPENLRTL